VRVDSVPDTVIARFFNFKHQPLLEFADSEKQDVDLRQLFN